LSFFPLTSKISTYSKKKAVGQWQRAMGLISEALAEGIRPDIITYNTAVALTYTL